MRSMGPNRLLPVLASLAGLLVGAVALESLARGYRVPPHVILVGRSGPGGNTAGPQLEEDEKEAPPAATEAKTEAHARARILLRRSEFDEGLALLREEARLRPDEPALQAELGYWLLVAGRPSDAISSLEQAMALGPTSYGTVLNLGIAYRRAGDLATAERILRGLVADRPSYRAASLALGVLLRRQGHLQEAIELLEATAAHGGNEERAHAHLQLGRAYLAAGQREMALREFDTAIDWAPALSDIRLGATWAFLNTGEPEDLAVALEYLEETRTIAPELPEVYSALGRIREMEGSLAGAEDAFIQALRLDPEYHSARRRLLRLYLEREDLAPARAQAEILLEMDADRPEHHFLAGLVAMRSGDIVSAKEAYQQAIALTEGRYPEAWYNLGITFRSAGDLPAAIAAYRQALENRPDYVEAMINLGAAHAASGQLDEAERILQRATEVDPNHATAWFHLGKLQIRRGEFLAAVASFQRARDVRPRYREAALNQGVALSRSGDIDGAITVYEQLTRDHPRYAKAYYNLSVALGKAGRRAQEYDAARKAVALDPGHVPSLTRLARLEVARGRYERAASLYRDLLDRDPGNDRGRVKLADVLRQTGDFQGCLDMGRAVASRNPRNRRAERLTRACLVALAASGTLGD